MRAPLLAAAVAVFACFAATAAEPESGEPAVRHTVIEDGRMRIDELRVRGQLQRVTVQPKGAAPSYDILAGDAGRDFADGSGVSRGAAGKRVWNVLRF